MKNSPNQRVYSLIHESYGRPKPDSVQVETPEQPVFDSLSAIACAVILVSGSVFVYVAVPALKFDAAKSVAGQIFSRHTDHNRMPIWEALEPIGKALE